MNGCIVHKKHKFYNNFQFQEYGEVDIRNTLIAASRINLDILVIDLDTAPATAILLALHTYRVQRPNTRIIILAQGRQPGDMAVAGVVALGIYDIIAPDVKEVIIPELERVIYNQPATYTQAARWAVQIEKEEPEAPKKKKLWERLKLIKTEDKLTTTDKSDEEVELQQPTPDSELLAEILKEIESFNKIKESSNTAVTGNTIIAVADGTATLGDTAGAILAIIYHLLRTGVYLLLLAGLIAFVLFVLGKVAGVFPVENNLTQFLIGISNTIGDYFKAFFKGG